MSKLVGYDVFISNRILFIFLNFNFFILECLNIILSKNS